jgi:hypothetical protein
VTTRVALCLVALTSWVRAAAAQDYRLRLDTRVQSVAWRGVRLDSVPAAALQPDSFTTTEGHAVTCLPGFEHCYFFRPEPARRAMPLVATADLAVWGLGIPGLSLRATSRVGADLGNSGSWPGTEPAVELLEGFMEYAARRVTVALGRTHEVTRLGFTGYDGGRIAARSRNGSLSGTIYGGWVMARGVALPVTSPALNPLDDYQPRERHLVLGGDAAWRVSGVRGRAVYQREVDPRTSYFVSERFGVELMLSHSGGIHFTGGADYDMANGWWGSAEASLGYTAAMSRAAGQVGVRRYRPHFPLWTIWGAFSPVPHSGLFASGSAVLAKGLEVRGRGERYWYPDAEAATPLMTAVDGGWRYNGSISYGPVQRLELRLGHSAEFGAGSSARGFDAAARWRPAPSLDVELSAASLLRPLEFRYSTADVRLLGLDAVWRAGARMELTGAVRRYAEVRGRPDAAAMDWNQWRFSLAARMLFGSGADRRGIPEPVYRVPEGDRP